MKKAISIFLSILCVFMTLIPAFAAEGDEAGSDVSEEKKYYSVHFTPPSAEYEGAYFFVKTINGVIQFEEDPNGEYCYFEGRYMLPSNVRPDYQHEIPPERYSPAQWDEVTAVAEGETISFRVVTSEKYNVLTAAVFVNESPATLNAQDEYAIHVDTDLTIRVIEKDSNGQESLLRNHYNVKLTSGDGYKVLTLKDEYYHVSYYGDSFRFRIRVLDGYSAAGIKVSVQRGPGMFDGVLDEEDTDMIVGILGGTETLTSYGVDEDGCRLYEIENITSDCRIIVSGLQEESSVGIMAMFKRILRLILDFLGIKIDFIDSLTAYYTVKVDGAQAPDGVTYQVIRSASDDLTPSEFNVTGGDGITIIVTKKSAEQDVNVTWTPGNELGGYKTDWKPSYNSITGEITYSAVYNIDNISADTTVVIH